jgi:hypothetical protein
MTLTLMSLMVWLVIALAPETPIGRTLKHDLVDRLAIRLNRVTGGQAALMGTVVIAGSLAVWLGSGDGVRMTGMAMPDVATWLASAELTAYLDFTVAAIATWSTLRVYGLRARLESVLRLARGAAPISHRSRRSRRSVPEAANDDAAEEPRRAAA